MVLYIFIAIGGNFIRPSAQDQTYHAKKNSIYFNIKEKPYLEIFELKMELLQATQVMVLALLILRSAELKRSNHLL